MIAISRPVLRFRLHATVFALLTSVVVAGPAAATQPPIGPPQTSEV